MSEPYCDAKSLLNF